MEPKLPPSGAPDDQGVDAMLRPTHWDDYVGQANIKENLRIILEAARQRKEACDHLLFYGQAGLGKTTLAYLVAKELGASIRVTSGPSLEKVADVAAVLTNLEAHDVLFIDEAHRLNRTVEEVLYPAMEMRKLHLIIGKGPGARTLSLDLPPFTLIAATTRANLLSGPFRSRFGATFKLDYYEPRDIEVIIRRSARLLGMVIDAPAVSVIAGASRFTPRVANRLMKRVRDYAQVFGFGEVTREVARKTLAMLEVDERGLEPHDRRLLEVVIQKFHGGPAGVGAIAAALNDDRGVIEDVVEPYLMRIGLLNRTSAGRVATALAYEHLHIPRPDQLL